MGCCNSRPAGDDVESTNSSPSTLETHHQSSSTRAIAHSAAPPSTSLRHTARSLRPQPSLTTTSSTPRASTAAPDLTDQPNAPLRQHRPWSSRKRKWTTSQLARERYEFFETRVTGNAEIWAALRTVTELMRDGQLPTAQEILNAAGITLPTGDLVNGAYDLTGQLYKIPPEILRDPENVEIDQNDDRSSTIGGKTFALNLEGKEVDDSDEDSDAAELRREEKGKGNERDALKIKCRLSDRGGPDVIMVIGRSQHVSVLIRKLAGQVNIPNGQRIRIAYLGKIMKEHESLDSQGWREGHVVNALVSLRPDVGRISSAGG
ncbi:putative ubiquitin domain-containing protein [Phaeomoniella chlamydospora]|uniref:Putative ubiquitin domain-containing protein n=1 Tax=Phaeomoniella chlamydospora TaxID=158046 RepID=A0A0G2HF78_PHACM|nr:putative ubiquitin domain-containing protein [Phaeomoniella chlamydospora]